jgi:hypothetical protein
LAAILADDDSREAFAVEIYQMDGTQGEPSARDVLRDWARAPGYSKRAAEYLELARCAPLPAVRKRYVTIAEHYRKLAEVEKRAQIKKTRMPDPTSPKPDVAEKTR